MEHNRVRAAIRKEMIAIPISVSLTLEFYLFMSQFLSLYMILGGE